MLINNVYCIDNVEGMKQLEDNYIDLTITSPPYDNMRTYNGYSFNFKEVAQQLYRITKGTVVWVVGDQTKNGSESGTSFRQALYFMEIGFNLHDTMIYHKRAVGACGSRYSYQQAFEYMFILTKGKIKTFNPIKDLKPKRAGQIESYSKTRSTIQGYTKERVNKITPDSSKRQNVWTYDLKGKKSNHPAIFPEELVKDHILTWSNEKDLIFDPFLGSGTTCKIAKQLNRNFDISEEYIQYAKRSIND